MNLAARFAAILHALCAAVARRGANGAFVGETSRPGSAFADPHAMTVLLWSRLQRAIARFARLAAGAPPPRPRKPPARPARARSAPDLPRRRGWLLAPVPEATAAASQLRAFLAEPETRALIAAEPRLGRILRPLCRTLGILLPAPQSCPRRPRAPGTPAAADPPTRPHRPARTGPHPRPPRRPRAPPAPA
ncbi:hypothetical protein ACMV_23270 [Acidiphilium multivorum AIU301]|uniref:Uncharacterized protein n=1 Tax=Acidiphilium multivorum (strain DSM 11245 / JCM 8867 / NBRC 100883 / AIU 301) TaxID=926570 RepID=F0J0Y8_ACIMA|nr:hypothetical protein [Acidiphilium multivorum]BAJ81674.1 hypothetical protein ACMV_23270 [Acidiphilium multivorum AIU301]